MTTWMWHSSKRVPDHVNNRQENDCSIWIRWIVISSRNDCIFKHCRNAITLHFFAYSYWHNRFNIYITPNAEKLLVPKSNEQNVCHHVFAFAWCQPTCMLIVDWVPKTVCAFSIIRLIFPLKLVCLWNFFRSIVTVSKSGRIFHMTLISVLWHYARFGNNMLHSRSSSSFVHITLGYCFQ